MVSKAFEQIVQSEKYFIDFLQDVCNIESPTNHKEGVDRVSTYFADWAKNKGFKVERLKQPVSGDVVCITMNPEAKGEPIALSAHLDTVHPIGLFGTPAVKIVGDRIYGPGVLDCKGGAVAAAQAMNALSDCGYTDRPVMLLLQTDEEGSSMQSNKATINYICEKAKGVTAFLNLEGNTAGKITTERKGILNLLFKIKGIEAHSSRCAILGASAICEAAHKIIEMEKLKDHEGLTCNCGTIKGGSVPNTVAGSCEFVANIRFANAEQLSYVREYAQHIADTVYVKGCSCELSEISLRVAMEYTDRNAELVARLNKAWKASGLSELEMNKSTGGSDAADTTAYGIPTVDSIGVQGGGIHSPNEYALIPSLSESAMRLVSAIVLI